MTRRSLTRLPWGVLAGAVLVGLLVVPLLALVSSSSASDFAAGVSHPSFGPALLLSLRSTAMSLTVLVLSGTPLAWWLATSRSRWARWVAVLVELPIVIPPAVVGVALLQAFGRQGWFGPSLDAVGVTLPFTESAVVLAQIFVAAPFYVRAAANALSKVDPETLVVARTLGASPPMAFFKVAMPTAMPGLLAAASLAWARALGEFGATLVFAGNMPGETQTLPLAIYTALESDVRLAVVFSVVTIAIASLLLLGLRGAGRLWTPGSRSPQ